MKEIIIIADSDPRRKVVGGVGVYSYNLTKFLLKKGLKVTYIAKKSDGNIIFINDRLDDFFAVQAFGYPESSQDIAGILGKLTQSQIGSQFSRISGKFPGIFE